METWSSYIDGLGREGCAADPAALLRPGLELELVRQPANLSRPFAVAICRHGTLIGYLPKPDARPIAKLMDQGGTARAFVLGLQHRLGLRGRALQGATLEIELIAPPGESLAALDLPDRGEVDTTLARRRRGRLAFYARTGAALCLGAIGFIAWAGMPDDDGEDEPAPRALAIAARAAAPNAKTVIKTQERPATAPVAAAPAARPQVAPPVAVAPAGEPPTSETQTSGIAAVEAPVVQGPIAPVPVATFVVSPVPSASVPGEQVAALPPPAAEAAPAAAREPEPAAAPEPSAPAKVADAEPLAEAVPLPIASPRRASVPLPVPRPAVPRNRARKR